MDPELREHNPTAGGCLVWCIGAAIVLAIAGAIFGVGPFAGDRYTCYDQPIAYRTVENATTNLTKDQATQFLRVNPGHADCYGNPR